MIKKRLINFSLSVLVGVGLMLVSIWQAWPDTQLHFITCDVGQGDAVLLTYGFHQILIDTGPSSQGVLNCLGKHLPWWDRHIELVVLTHPDADHIGGAPAVLKRYRVGSVIFNGDYKPSELFREAMSALQVAYQQGTEVKLPVLGHQWVFSQEQTGFLHKQVRNPQPLTLTLLSPRVEQTSEAVETWLKTETLLWDEAQLSQVLGVSTEAHNDRSIVLLLTFGKTRALLVGDLEQTGELSLLAAGVIPQVNILKVGHHGAKTSSSEAWLETTKPEISLVSVGKDNRYHHPSPEVIARLMQFDTTVWRTDDHGTIEVISDGESYAVSGER